MENNNTEIIEELLEIKEQIHTIAHRLEEIGRVIGYDSWHYNVITGYVTPYLLGTIGEERTIMMSLQNVIDRLQDEDEEDEDYEEEDESDD